MLREWSHQDYYHADMTGAEVQHMQSHLGMFPDQARCHHRVLKKRL